MLLRPQRWAVTLLIAIGLLYSTSARADDSRPPEKQAKTAAETANAPAPADAHGTTASRVHTDGWLWLPRVLLFVPRVAAEIAFAPPRALLWTYERFSLANRFESMFFNYDGTIGLFPLAFFETGFGLNAGARFVYKDLWAQGGELKLRASYGGRFQQLYSANATSGRLLGDNVSVDWQTSFQSFSQSRFFGIGNADLVPANSIVMLEDPTSVAVDTRYRHDDARIELGLTAKLTTRLTARASIAILERELTDEDPADDGIRTTLVYDRTQLAGIDGLHNLLGDIELTYDGRRATRDNISIAAPATGWRLSAFASFANGIIKRDPSRYIRYGADVQRYFDIWGGDRVLVLRAYFEAVTGSLQEVPFLDLPHLGGPQLLRGYPRHRFRDRVAALATVEYMYPIERNMAGYLFVDTGRVYRDVNDLSVDDLRVGFGGGIQLQSYRSFIMRLWVGSSIDGGFLFNLSFDPVFDHRSRRDNP